MVIWDSRNLYKKKLLVDIFCIYEMLCLTCNVFRYIFIYTYIYVYKLYNHTHIYFLIYIYIIFSTTGIIAVIHTFLSNYNRNRKEVHYYRLARS